MVDLGVDLAGEEAGAEAVVVAMVGVVALAGAGKQAKAQTRTVDEIMHSIRRPDTCSKHPTIEIFIPNWGRKSC